MEVAQQMRAMAVPPQGSAVAMGFFVGVHKGHQAVIKTAVEAARRQGLAPALFTFRLPPESRIKGPRLLPTEEKHRRKVASKARVCCPLRKSTAGWRPWACSITWLRPLKSSAA